MMKTKGHQILKSYMGNNKDSWGIPDTIGTIRFVSDKKRKCSSGKSIANVSNFDKRMEIPKKVDQHSHRVTKENKVGHHMKKNSEIPINKEYANTFKKLPIQSINLEEKKSYSVKKNRDSSVNQKSSNNYSLNASKIKQKQEPNSIEAFAEENKCLKQTVKILGAYIASMNKQFENKIKNYNKEKDEIIKQLKNKNDFLMKENKNLKLKLLEIIYMTEIYDNNENNRDIQTQKFLSQLFTENIYLRKANISLNNISEDLFIRKAKTSINPNAIKDNLTQDNKQQEEQIINNNPFQNYKNDLPQNKTKHKRQRTHVQLNEIQNEEDNNSSKTPTIVLTSNSTSTVVDSSKNTDAFGDTLEDLSNFTKTMRRNNDSKKNVFDDIDAAKEGVISPTSSQLLSSNKKQLFYRTPRDKEKKKIEFTN